MQGLILIGHYLVSLYTMIVLLRFSAQWLGVDFRNPISQFIVNITNPPLLPLRRVVPGWRGKDMASLVLALGLIFIELLLFALLFGAKNYLALIPIVFFRAIIVVINLYFYILIINAIISWINQDPYHPARLFFSPITAPLLRPLQKRIPLLGGAVDVTPMIVLVLIYFLQIQLPLWFSSAMQGIGLAGNDPAINALIGLMSR